nr:hypothetical protein [Nanoarchaeum sp.]
MKATIKIYSGLEFSRPAYKGNYAECQRQIAQAGEQTPTYAQIADLAYETIVEYPSNEMKQIIKQNGLFGFTGSLFVPKGVYVQDRPILGSDGLPIMKESELEAKLQAGDPSVRFVESGFKIGNHSMNDLRVNPYVIALAGRHGATQLAYIASNYKNDSYVFGLENVCKPKTIVSGGLSVYTQDFDDGLFVGGNRGEDSRTFGMIPKSGEVK